MDENQGVQKSEGFFRMAIGVAWLVTGAVGLASFLMPQYEMIGEGINGIDLIRALDKDMEQVAKFIGVFTTFMMYFALVMMLIASGFCLIAGIRGVLGNGGGWLLAILPAAFSFATHFFTMILLNSSDGGSGFAFLADKFRPEPGWAFWMMMTLFALVSIANVFLNATGRLKPATIPTYSEFEKP